MFFSFTLVMFAKEIPFVQMPATFMSEKPESGFFGEISRASTNSGQFATRIFENE